MREHGQLLLSATEHDAGGRHDGELFEGGPLGLAGRAAEIEMQRLAGLVDEDVDAHRLFQIDAIVINEAFRLEAAIAAFKKEIAKVELFVS